MEETKRLTRKEVLEKIKESREKTLEKIKELEVKEYNGISPLVRIKTDYPSQDSSFKWYRILNIDELDILKLAYPNLWYGEIEDEIPNIICIEIDPYDNEGYQCWSLGRIWAETVFFMNQFLNSDIATYVANFTDDQLPRPLSWQIFRERQLVYLKNDIEVKLADSNYYDVPGEILDELVEEFERRENAEIGDLYIWDDVISRKKSLLEAYKKEN